MMDMMLSEMYAKQIEQMWYEYMRVSIDRVEGDRVILDSFLRWRSGTPCSQIDGWFDNEHPKGLKYLKAIKDMPPKLWSGYSIPDDSYIDGCKNMKSSSGAKQRLWKHWSEEIQKDFDADEINILKPEMMFWIGREGFAVKMHFGEV